MSTPKISFRVPGASAEPPEPTGDVVAHELGSAPGKDRERDPLYGGELGNISEGMAVDDAPTGMSLTVDRTTLAHWRDD